MEHRRELEQALRRNRGLRIKPKWLSELSEACDCQASEEMLLSLRHTADLKKKFFGQVAAHENTARFYPRESHDVLMDDLAELAQTVGDSPCILFSEADEYIGAIRLPPRIVLTNASRVWAVVKQDLCLVTEELSSGLCLGIEYYMQEEYIKAGVFQLTTWGTFAGEEQ